MIKVNYNTETTLAQGYYPDSINYTSIPEPYIEIEDSAQVLDKQMCVVNGVYQEYLKPLDVQLEEAKASKLSILKRKRDEAKRIPAIISVDSFSFSVTESDIKALENRVHKLTTTELASSKWTDTLGFRRDLSLGQFEQLLSRIRTHLNDLDVNIFDLYSDLKIEIENCETLEELENININF